MEQELFTLPDLETSPLAVADPEIFISGGLLTDLRGGPLQSRFSDSLYKQPNFFPKRAPPLNPPMPGQNLMGFILLSLYFSMLCFMYYCLFVCLFVFFYFSHGVVILFLSNELNDTLVSFSTLYIETRLIRRRSREKKEVNRKTQEKEKTAAKEDYDNEICCCLVSIKTCLV